MANPPESPAAEVMTVLGPVRADRLGVVLPHEHLFCNTLREYRSDGLLDDLELAVRELRRFKAAGGGTVVELTCPTFGRRPDLLREASDATGVHIVMGCGHYRDPYLADTDLDRRTVAQIGADLVAEFTEGVDGVRPGIIGEVGADAGWVSALEERALRAAAWAQARTGATISLHAARWPVGRDILNILAECGVPMERVVVGHLDTVNDPQFHLEVVRRGCWAEFDGFTTDVPYDTERIAGYVARLVEAGHHARVLLSHDLFRLSHFHSYGGVGLTHLLDEVPQVLRAHGVADDIVSAMLTTNPQRALSAHQPP
jgi:predicted metal-dependent phosphotriesterase family hydrolase